MRLGLNGVEDLWPECDQSTLFSEWVDIGRLVRIYCWGIDGETMIQPSALDQQYNI